MDEMNKKYHLRPSNALGNGSYGTVYEGVDKETNVIVAVKEQLFIKISKAKVEKEIEFLRELSPHKNIVTLLDYYMTDELCLIVLEYAFEGRSLHDLVYNSNRLSELFTVVTENDIRQIFLQCVDALTYAMDRNICHRDVKPANILIKSINDEREEKFEVLLSDFNISTKLTHPLQQMNTDIGTPAFKAPELGNNYNYKSDIYSLGKTLYFLLSWGETVWNAIVVTDETSPNYGKKELIFPESQMDQFRRVSKSATYIVEVTTRINPDIRSTYPKIYELSENWKTTARTDYDLNRFHRDTLIDEAEAQANI